ncbi:MAG: CRISPR-associated endoribonuclease Cas6 [Thermodesulfobacteriota bacterium]
MRLRLLFHTPENGFVIPLNYNYYLTSIIYDSLKRASPEFSRFLHDKGYQDGFRSFKFFTYSQLRSEKREIKGNVIRFLSQVEWFISSPTDDFILNFLNGVFETAGIKIGDKKLPLQNAEVLEPPKFSDKMKFKCLSPITISRVDIVEGSGSPTSLPLDRYPRSQRVQHFIRPWESDLSEKISQNLVRKFRLLYGKEPSNSSLKIELDSEYKSGRNIEKLVNFKGTNIKGFMSPFTVEGNPELIEVGHETGFGDKNSMGFGMVEAKRDK